MSCHSDSSLYQLIAGDVSCFYCRECNRWMLRLPGDARVGEGLEAFQDAITHGAGRPRLGWCRVPVRPRRPRLRGDAMTDKTEGAREG
jgi:hypothetical protein